MVKKIDTKELKQLMDMAQVLETVKDPLIFKAVFEYVENNYPGLLPQLPEKT